MLSHCTESLGCPLALQNRKCGNSMFRPQLMYGVLLGGWIFEWRACVCPSLCLWTVGIDRCLSLSFQCLLTGVHFEVSAGDVVQVAPWNRCRRRGFDHPMSLRSFPQISALLRVPFGTPPCLREASKPCSGLHELPGLLTMVKMAGRRPGRTSQWN